MDTKKHWETIYRTKPTSEVSWFQPEAKKSLELIRRVAPERGAPIVDVGGGASVLADDLLVAGYTDITVLDLARSALDSARARLGAAASERVQWLEADVRTAQLAAARYAVWHDRAVFHFLTEAEDRARYVAQVSQAVRPGGYVIVATFADDGPTRCSGLPVHRYSTEALHDEFGSEFRLVASERENHETPGGEIQAFIYCLCRWDGPAR